MQFDREFTMTINGKSVAGADTIDVINPANGEVFASCPRADKNDLETAVTSARAAFDVWKNTPIETRKQKLKEAAQAIMANADPLASLFTKDQGRPTHLAK